MTATEIHRFFQRIYEVYYYDFRSYSQASIKRRLQFLLGKYNFDLLSDLEKRVFSDQNFFFEILQFLFVPTTEMFRTPSQFAIFRQEIVPMLRTYPSLKIWVAGCSTGEEVYSYAIILDEEGLLEKTMIYATDINLQSLAKAKAGVYALEKIKAYSKNYIHSGGPKSLSEYYVVRENSAMFSEHLKKNVVFSDHCLATDNVFAEVQMVSCRNVLIYFEKPLQDRAIGLFSDSLCRMGYLALGDKETLRFSAHKGRFLELPQKNSFYQKVAL